MPFQITKSVKTIFLNPWAPRVYAFIDPISTTPQCEEDGELDGDAVPRPRWFMDTNP